MRAVGGLQRDRRAAAAESLESRLLLVDQRDHDVAGIGALAFLDHSNVAIEDADIDHRITTHLQSEMLARREQIRRHVDDIALILDGFDWGAGSDASHHGDRNRPGIILVRGWRPDPSEIAFDDARHEAARSSVGDATAD